jgi:hypothetical protein
MITCTCQMKWYVTQVRHSGIEAHGGCVFILNR